MNDDQPVELDAQPTMVATMAEVMERFEVVSIVNEDGVEPFMVVSPRQLSDASSNVSAPSVDMRELGSSSPSPFTSWIRAEYNRDLQGLKGLQVFDRMRKSDGTVRGTLRLVKTPPLAARWYMEPAAGGPNNTIRPKDKAVADFVWCSLTKWMSISWSQFLQESLLMAEFGYYMFEKVWENRTIKGKYRTVWKKLAPRHPMDVKEWHYDANGGPSSVEMWPTDNAGFLGEPISIPINKLVVFTFDKEAGNIEGISLLRTPYKHWYYKEQLYKIDAIQKERHGIGIPMITLPPGFSTDDRNLAEQMGRNLRTNERAHVVLPPMWELVMLKLEGQPVDSLKSIEHHDMQIEKSILASFVGNSGNSDVQSDLFLKATRFIADTICNTINDYAIPELVMMNFPGVTEFPKLKARRIGENADWQAMSFALRNLIGANVIRPDDPLEASMREEMDLPPADPATVRETATPQAGGVPGGKPTPPNAQKNDNQTKAGPPRQAPPSAKAPAGNAGTDRNGK